jgi:hypothetical protein
MTDTFRALCAELAENVRYLLDCVADGDRDPAAIAECVQHLAATRTALAQPETQGPTNEELMPVPVSERLPGAQDCDADGVCWWWSQDITAWCLCFAADGDLSEWTHWLPHWAIPLP